jgi:hypothetical protein
MWMVIGLAAAVLAQAQDSGVETVKPYGLLLQGEDAEAFLRTAHVVDMKSISTGITHPQRVTLNDGVRTLRGVWKTIDETKQGVTPMEGGRFQVDFRDSYKFEIAAYELDKLIGLDLVPPTVEREIQNERGSLQLWVEGVMTEYQRIKEKIDVPDPDRWNEQIYKVRLMHQLTYDTDYNNTTNLIVDPAFRIYAIDFSRAFRKYDALLSEKDLARFSRSALDGLRRLDRAVLEEKLGRWLTRHEITALLKRRDRILALAERRVAEKGEAVALYP